MRETWREAEHRIPGRKPYFLNRLCGRYRLVQPQHMGEASQPSRGRDRHGHADESKKRTRALAHFQGGVVHPISSSSPRGSCPQLCLTGGRYFQCERLVTPP